LKLQSKFIIIFYIFNLNLSIWLLWGRVGKRGKLLGGKRERKREKRGERVSEHARDQNERESEREREWWD
jgi:hypothetical protein